MDQLSALAGELLLILTEEELIRIQRRFEKYGKPGCAEMIRLELERRKKLEIL